MHVANGGPRGLRPIGWRRLQACLLIPWIMVPVISVLYGHNSRVCSKDVGSWCSPAR